MPHRSGVRRCHGRVARRCRRRGAQRGHHPRQDPWQNDGRHVGRRPRHQLQSHFCLQCCCWAAWRRRRREQSSAAARSAWRACHPHVFCERYRRCGCESCSVCSTLYLSTSPTAGARHCSQVHLGRPTTPSPRPHSSGTPHSSAPRKVGRRGMLLLCAETGLIAGCHGSCSCVSMRTVCIPDLWLTLHGFACIFLLTII